MVMVTICVPSTIHFVVVIHVQTGLYRTVVQPVQDILTTMTVLDTVLYTLYLVTTVQYTACRGTGSVRQDISCFLNMEYQAEIKKYLIGFFLIFSCYIFGKCHNCMKHGCPVSKDQAQCILEGLMVRDTFFSNLCDGTKHCNDGSDEGYHQCLQVITTD